MYICMHVFAQGVHVNVLLTAWVMMLRQSRVEIGGDPGYRNGSGGQRGITPGTGNDATGLGNIIIIIIPCLGRV